MAGSADEQCINRHFETRLYSHKEPFSPHFFPVKIYFERDMSTNAWGLTWPA
jgi:hypothetical protein